MDALVIFDSNHGNTKIIAQTISDEIGKGSKTMHVSEMSKESLQGVSLIIVGSPILGWQPSEKTIKFLDSLSKGQLKGKKAASFDTRMKVFFHGDAMSKISEKLRDAGAQIIIDPMAFYVKGRQGPLLDGEKERAADWAKAIRSKLDL